MSNPDNRYKTVGELLFDIEDKVGSDQDGESTVFKGNFKSNVIAVKRTKNASYNEDFFEKFNMHPNILHFYRKEKDSEFTYIGTELCAGNLEDMIVHKTYDGPPVGDTNKEILHQITAGLAHFHLLKFVHGNLKPTNILISIPSGTMKPVMKLADFDHSRNKKGLSGLTQSFFSSANDQYRFVYTRGWIAPETITKDICNASSDIFLLGLLFAFTLNDGKHAFGDDYLDRIKRIEKKEAMIATAKELDKKFPGALKLIEWMLSQEPTKRPKVRQILDDPFFTQSSQVQAQQRTSTLIPQPVATTTLVDQPHQQLGETTTSTNDLNVPAASVVSSPVAPAIDSMRDPPSSASSATTSASANDSQQVKLKGKAKLADFVSSKVMKSTNNRLIKKKEEELLDLCSRPSMNASTMARFRQLVSDTTVDINYKDSAGYTPINMLCCKNNNYSLKQCVEILLEREGIDVTIKNREKWNPLHHLCRHYKLDNLIDIVRLIIVAAESSGNKKQKFNINDKTSHNSNALILLCEANCNFNHLADVARLLIERNIEVTAENKDQRSALHFLKGSDIENKEELIQLLKDKGAADE